MKDNYILKTYAGWLGKIIGIRLGAPIEGWTKEKIQLFYGNEFKDYVVDYQDFAADDDSNGPLFFVKALELFDEITPQNMGTTLLNYIPKEHGFFWWGKELSTEHTAYNNLLKGIKAPLSGSAKTNGQIMAEQIGGQIFIDCFGFVTPSNPAKGADLAEASARVTHDLDGVEGARFIAACVSLAYDKDNVIEIVKEALTYINNKEGDYYKVVKFILDIYSDGKSEEEAFELLKRDFWMDKYPGICHIIPNAGIIAISLLYGNGNFAKTMEIVNLLGFDTDCNAGNVGAILGILSGTYEDDKENGIPKHLILPIKDIVIASSIVGSLNISTISENTLMFCKLGYKLAQEEMPSPYKELWNNLEQKGERISDFRFTDALCGFRIKGSYKNAEVSLKNEKDRELDKNVLKILINNIHPTNKVEIYQKTFYEAKDLHDARYEPCFSPIAYCGDLVSCRIKNVTGQKLKVSLYSYDMINDKKSIISTASLEDSFTSNKYFQLQGEIPFLKAGIIKTVGIEVESLEENDLYFGEQVVLLMDYFSIKSNPNVEIDFSKLYFDDYSLHSAKQKELIGFTHYQSNVDGIVINENGIVLKGEEKIYTGDYYWKDYGCSLEFSIDKSSTFDFLIRSQGIMYAYILRISYDSLQIVLKNGEVETVLHSTSICVDEGKINKLKVEAIQSTIRVEFNQTAISADNDRLKNGFVGIQVPENSEVELNKLRIYSL